MLLPGRKHGQSASSSPVLLSEHQTTSSLAAAHRLLRTLHRRRSHHQRPLPTTGTTHRRHPPLRLNDRPPSPRPSRRRPKIPEQVTSPRLSRDPLQVRIKPPNQSPGAATIQRAEHLSKPKPSHARHLRHLTRTRALLSDLSAPGRQHRMQVIRHSKSFRIEPMLTWTSRTATITAPQRTRHRRLRHVNQMLHKSRQRPHQRLQSPPAPRAQAPVLSLARQTTTTLNHLTTAIKRTAITVGQMRTPDGAPTHAFSHQLLPPVPVCAWSSWLGVGVFEEGNARQGLLSAQPCHAQPCHALPCHAMPGRVRP
ncbi:Uncharacterised protein [Actinomyces bovis]|uniref:Uncharacterized protein n=1 Tax=Actinomyces bovis TaxID=1658 RepID=A0ABY1VP01_9ACTO|nr:Uncharacterised protein [Actinomyces bovis]VEG53136.1 Uncharacterised protein [Actinomyces israelii]